MVEFNANGLYSFFSLLKNLSVASVKFGKEWIVWLIKQTILKSKVFKDYIKQKFLEYFLKDDLNKDQL